MIVAVAHESGHKKTSAGLPVIVSELQPPIDVVRGVVVTVQFDVVPQHRCPTSRRPQAVAGRRGAYTSQALSSQTLRTIVRTLGRTRSDTRAYKRVDTEILARSSRTRVGSSQNVHHQSIQSLLHQNRKSRSAHNVTRMFVTHQSERRQVAKGGVTCEFQSTVSKLHNASMTRTYGQRQSRVHLANRSLNTTTRRIQEGRLV